MFIIRNKKIFIIISMALVTLSIASMVFFGFKVGIDFKGGALTEVSYAGERPAQEALNVSLEALGLGTVSIQPTGEAGYIVKTKDLTEEEHRALLGVLGENRPDMTEVSFNSIGPTVGKELTRKSILTLILVSLGIIIFIAYAFRKVSGPSGLGHQAVASWKYGLIAIVTLLHDVIIPSGLFVIFSHYFGAELDTLFVVAVLTILGLSVSDTIVIFDRIRENLRLNIENRNKEDFGITVGRSLEQSFARSIATSLTVILVLVSLVLFGPVTTKYFALMLAAGMFVGTYSSIFLASSLLAWVEEQQTKKLASK